ncbi:hypothetical protein E2C01_027720 [Portunus trituberculatus]|uniref:Uncharacterized protein n=1 Tax=Portunus trituberculatus TaxID=210409 RepID=A0A5B7ELM7_PORTR|nr:hypothetical protein [Portunus trituberculatus]
MQGPPSCSLDYMICVAYPQGYADTSLDNTILDNLSDMIDFTCRSIICDRLGGRARKGFESRTGWSDALTAEW